MCTNEVDKGKNALQILDTILQPCILLDKGGKIIYLNKAANIVFHVGEGVHISTIFPGDPFRQCLETIIENTGKNSGTSRCGFTGIDTNQNYSIEITSTEQGAILFFHDLITPGENVSTLEQLKTQMHFIRSITETIPDIIFVTESATGRVEYINSESLLNLGFTPDKISEMSVEERLSLLIHPEDQVRLMNFYLEINKASDEDTLTVEIRVRNLNVDWTWMRIRGKVFRRDENGSPTHTINIGHDITEMKTAEEKIREQHHLITKITETIPDLVSVMEYPSLELIYFNREPFLLQGFNGDEIRKMTKEERDNLVHPEDFHLMKTYFAKFTKMSDTDLASTEYRAKSNKGEWLWFRVRGRVFDRNPNGTVKNVLNVVQNITDQRKAEEEKQNSDFKLRRKQLLLNEAEIIGKMGSWEANLETGELYWSDELYRIYGLEPQSVALTIETCIDQFVHPDDKQKIREHIYNVVHNHSNEYVEIRIRTGEGEKVVVSQPQKMSAESSRTKIIRGIVRDVTAEKLAEEELLRLRLSQQKETLNAVLLAQEVERKRIGEGLHNGVGQLLYAAKIRNELIKVNNTTTREQLNVVSKMLEEAIAETRNISFQLVPTVLKDFGVEHALGALLSRLNAKELSFSYETEGMEERLPENYEISIYRMTQELVNNIIRHSGAKKALISVKRNPESIQVLVKDDGVGFDVSRTAKMNNGIGLPGIRNRVELLNATLRIESEPGTGTLVAIGIPLNKTP